MIKGCPEGVYSKLASDGESFLLDGQRCGISSAHFLRYIIVGIPKNQVGDSVTVVDGYLEGFVGVVDSIDPDKGVTKVTVSMMGKEIPVELELDQVEPLVE